MKKYLVLLPVLFLIAAPARAELSEGPWMVCEVTASGNKNINTKSITKQGSAKKGEMYERSYVYEDVKNIVAMGNFDKAEVDISPLSGTRKHKEDGVQPCHKITYLVEEKPIFDKILFKGRKKLSKSAITTAMTLKLKDPYNEARLAGDMKRIEDKYAEKGYVNTKASYETEFDEKQNIAIVTVIMDEGVRTRVGGVEIEGANFVPEKKLIKKTANRAGKVYKPQKMQTDYYKMALYGRNKGFNTYDLSKPELSYNEDKSLVNIKYTALEGEQSKFGSVSFEGNTIYTEAEMREMVMFRPGKMYNQNDYDLTLRTIQEKYGDKGYLQAAIVPEPVRDESGYLNIKFDITESHVFYVDHVDVSGYENTKRYVFAREITVKPGERFDYEKIKRSQTKLLNLGFLNDVNPEISPTYRPNMVDVDFNVKEGSAGMFTAAVAMSSLDGLYGELSVNHLNLFGRAQRASFRTLFGKDILDFTVSWTTPWVFDRPVSFGVDLFNTRRNRPFMNESHAYTERRTGGRVNIGPRFSEDIYQMGLFYSLQNIDVFDIDELFQNDIPTGDKLKSTLGASFAVDTRDSAWDPTSGWRNSIGADISGGPLAGDLDIWSVNLRSAYNKQLFNLGGNYPVTFVLSNRFVMSKPYGDTDELPVYERYFIGGADTLRGYKNTGQVGNPAGNEAYWVANAEIRLPLAREGRRNIVQLALFADAGTAWNKFSDIDWEFGSQSNQLKAGVGLGIRFATPALPIRIDWGYGLNHKEGDDKTHFYFNMTSAF